MNNIRQAKFFQNKSVLLGCIDEYADGKLKGRLLSAYLPEPMYFQTMEEMLKKIDNLYDCLDFPQAYCDYRSFQKTDSEGLIHKKVELLMVDNNLANEKGKKATFIVQVKFRQNASWQGSITWADKNKSQNFRSALELIKLIDSALEEGQNYDKIGWQEKQEVDNNG